MPNHTTIPHDIHTLQTLLLQLATLNIILCDQEWLRYHRYHKQWSANSELATIDNGSGDTVFFLFSKGDCVVKGFDHESPVSPYAQEDTANWDSQFDGMPPPLKTWDGLYEGLPPHLAQGLNDKALNKEDATFCFWRTADAEDWSQGPVVFPNNEDDGSEYLLEKIYANAADFKEWADDYFGLDLSASLIAKVYHNEVVTDEIILGLNPSCEVETVKIALKDLGRAV